MLDCVIRGGFVIDGTGAPRRRADIGIKAGRIVAIGAVEETGRETIEATNMVVAPGFIDVHTHYDAQIMWDPALTPSSLHGVTTVIGGNCGFTIAPISPESADYIVQMLATVEGMPVEALRQGLSIDWTGFGEWLGRLDGRVALNVGFLAGHSTIRRHVMGDDWRRPARLDEIEIMRIALRTALDEGALGFSSSWGTAHADHRGDPVPSRFAEHGELVALASELKGREGTMLEFIGGTEPRYPMRSIEAMTAMTVASGRPLNWNVLMVNAGSDDDAARQRLSSTSEHAAAQGGVVKGLILPMPQVMRITMAFLGFNLIESWRVFLGQDRGAMLRGLGDPAQRETLRLDADANDDARAYFDFRTMIVESVTNPALKSLEGRVLGDIAAERGVHPVDAFFDIQLADNMRGVFKTHEPDSPEIWARRQEFWNDPRTLVGASDAGAHLDSLDSFVLYSEFVGPVVRRGLISLEEAVRKVTDEPARFFGLRERGRIAEGWHADIVIFDPDRIGPGPMTMRQDMPAGGSRLYAEAVGVEHVLVGGREIVRGGALTGAMPGTVLRSGRDTDD